MEKHWYSFLFFFLVSKKDLSYSYIYLTFYGVDTVAIVRLNHQEIGKCDNMFVQYKFEVKKYLKVNIFRCSYLACNLSELKLIIDFLTPSYSPSLLKFMFEESTIVKKTKKIIVEKTVLIKYICGSIFKILIRFQYFSCKFVLDGNVIF